MEIILAITVIAIVVVIACSDFNGRAPKKYHSRRCEGKHWLKRYSQYSKEEIREFLDLFTDAFAYSREEKLKFNPDDKILDIYRAE